MENGTGNEERRDSKERFTDRVDAYVKYRPSYPKEALDYLCNAAGLGKGSTVADIGSGTGNFAVLLLERGCAVYGVEPNAAMREAAESRVGGIEDFHSCDGSAERTGLPVRSMDAIVCAQAFHWFDQAAAREEFRRILKPGGKAALVWNSRLTVGTQFLEGYESLLRTFGTDYAAVNHKNISSEMLKAFFKEWDFKTARFPYRQLFDFEGLKGRLLSSSYSPQKGHPDYEPMITALRELLDRSMTEGKVSLDYETLIYCGEV